MQITHFYLLADDTLKTFSKSVCQLVAQRWSSGSTIYLYCDTEEKAQQFDIDLWTFKDTQFIPHGLLAEQNLPPQGLPFCMIGSLERENVPPDCKVLFNLTETVPPFFSNYSEVVEVVPVNEEARAKSRQRYKAYQAAGYRIKTETYEML